MGAFQSKFFKKIKDDINKLEEFIRTHKSIISDLENKLKDLESKVKTNVSDDVSLLHDKIKSLENKLDINVMSMNNVINPGLITPKHTIGIVETATVGNSGNLTVSQIEQARVLTDC